MARYTGRGNTMLSLILNAGNHIESNRPSEKLDIELMMKLFALRFIPKVMSLKTEKYSNY